MTDPLIEPFAFRPTVMDVDLDALEFNYRQVKQRVAPSKVMAVVKANAYGHGLEVCGGFLEELGADYLGVALVEEGILLRKAGIRVPVLVFGGIFGGQIGLYLDHSLDLTASSISKLQAIDECARGRSQRARVHIKIDTGMGRIGVRPESAAALFEAAMTCQNVDVVGVFSHFAAADEEDKKETIRQLNSFKSCIDCYPSKGLRPMFHMANSGAILQYPDSYFDMVRPGLLTYGVLPAAFLGGRLELKPVMSIRSSVVYFKVVPKGKSVSYGSKWTAEKDTRIVTVPVGYGDGYPRRLSNKGEMLIRGKRCRIAGRVCMDQTMVSIGDSEAYNGDEVVLIGKQGQEEITVSELAGQVDTVPHEILVMTNLRVPRRYFRKGREVGAG